MAQAEQGTEAFDPLAYWKSIRDTSMDTWSQMMRDFVNSDDYARASAQWLDTYLAMSEPLQRVMDQAMTQTLSQLKMPSTDDIGRLAKRLTNIELRIDDLDARLDEILKLVKGLASAVAAQPAAGKQAELKHPPSSPPSASERAEQPHDREDAKPATETAKASGKAKGHTEAATAVKSRRHAARSGNGKKGGAG